MGLVWRLEAFQKGPGTKGTRMEECKKNCEGQGRRRRRRQKKCKKKCKHKRKQNAKKMQTKCEENLGMQKKKKTQPKRKNNANKMQKKKKSKENAKKMQKHSVFAVFPIFQDQPRMRPAPTHLGCIIFALFLHFLCILVAFFLHYFCICFASFVAFAPGLCIFLHSSMRVPFAPGPFWKAPSLQTNPMIHDPQLGGRNSACG